MKIEPNALTSTSMQRPTQFLREPAAVIRQGNAAAGIDQYPAARDGQGDSVLRRPIDPANCPPLHLFPAGRLMQQADERQGHGFGVVGHRRSEARVERQ